MGIFQGDVLALNLLELALGDIKKDPWLIDNIFEQFVSNPYLKDKYAGQIAAAKEWFANNQVDLVMTGRLDMTRFPCVSLRVLEEQELADMRAMADLTTSKKMLLPSEIDRPIPWIVKPWDVMANAYDPDTGYVAVDESLPGMDTVVPGQLLVNPDTGQGFKINEVIGDYLVIDTDLDFKAARLGVLPEHRYYEARIERAFSSAGIELECFASGDIQTLFWLWSVVLYACFRYKEGLFEASDFTQTIIKSSEIGLVQAAGGPAGDKIWSRKITITGMVENTWVKAPKRILESVALREKTADGYVGGIQILSNSEPSIIDQSDVNWFAVNDDEE